MRTSTGALFSLMLIGLLTTAAGAQSPIQLKDRLDTIAKRQEEARREQTRQYHIHKTAEAQKPASDRFHAETGRNTEEVLALVVAHPHDPAAGEALQWVITTARAGPGDQSYRAMEILLRYHVRDPGMGELCGRLFYFVHAPVAESLIRAVLKQHPARADRGRACHALAAYLQYQARMVRQVRAKPALIDRYVHERHKAATERFVKEADPEALDREAGSLLERVVAEFADVPDWYDRRPLGSIAEGELFALRNLSVGKVAPGIVGKDHLGNPMSLREFQGKVVVLTFSGNWCGPCVGMYPQERELVARHVGKPFALVSVSTDDKVETLRKSIASGDITWRCWWDGGITGPITTRWGVLSFPSIFVLDRAGVIRFKDVRGDDLERSVAKLLSDAAGGPSVR